jgi:hypothetical protein
MGTQEIAVPVLHLLLGTSPPPPPLITFELAQSFSLSREIRRPCSPELTQEGDATNGGPRAFISYTTHHLPLPRKVVVVNPRFSSVLPEISHPSSTGPTQEEAARCCCPRVAISRPAHHLHPPGKSFSNSTDSRQTSYGVCLGSTFEGPARSCGTRSILFRLTYMLSRSPSFHAGCVSYS